MEAPTLQQLYSLIVYKSLTADPPMTPNEEGLHAIALPLWSAGRMTEAVACLRLLELRNSLRPDQYSVRGFWELNRGRTSVAKADFLAALERQPNHEWARFGYAHALFLTQDFGRAAIEFQSLIDSGTSLQGPRRMAPVAQAMASGQTPEAFELSPVPFVPPGMSEVMQIRRVQGPKAALERTLQITQQMPIPEDEPLLRHALELALEIGANDLAIEIWEDFCDRACVDGLVAVLGGAALARTGDRDASHKAFRYATISAPLEARAWGGYGAGLIERNDLDEAMKAYSIAIFLDDTLASFWTDLGGIHIIREDYEEAFRSYKKALECGDASFAVYLNCGICASNLGHEVEALRNWTKAAKLHPSHPRIEDILALASVSSQGDRRFVFDGDLSDSSPV